MLSPKEDVIVLFIVHNEDSNAVFILTEYVIAVFFRTRNIIALFSLTKDTTVAFTMAKIVTRQHH